MFALLGIFKMDKGERLVRRRSDGLIYIQYAHRGNYFLPLNEYWEVVS